LSYATLNRSILHPGHCVPPYRSYILNMSSMMDVAEVRVIVQQRRLLSMLSKVGRKRSNCACGATNTKPITAPSGMGTVTSQSRSFCG
jgi:hypothetical protein